MNLRLQICVGKTNNNQREKFSITEIQQVKYHLKKIVKYIESRDDIEILAIGIGHDVSRYYKKAIKISDVQELGDVMINQLSDLFDSNKSQTKH